MIINDRGKIQRFWFSTANVDYRDQKIIMVLKNVVFGKLFGYLGYIDQKLVKYLWNEAVKLIKKGRNIK